MAKHLFILLCILVVSGACNTSGRKTTKIPPLPTFDDAKRIEKSIEFLSEAIGKYPRAALNYQKRAELFTEKGLWNEALADINKALEITPGNGAFLLTRAKVLRQLKRYAPALADARTAEVSNQNSPELFIVLADLLQHNKQYSQGKLYITKALQMAPYNGEAYYYNGLIDAKQGDTITAISLIDECLRLKPRFLEAYVSLTDIYTQLHNYPVAMHYNRMGSKYFPKNVDLVYSRGLMYQSQGRMDSALHTYNKVFLMDPKHYMSAYQTGLIYMKWHAYGAAARFLERVARINPKFSKIHALLGIAFDKAGNLERAMQEYQLALETDKTDSYSRTRIGVLSYKKSYFDKYGVLPTYRTRSDGSSDSNAVEEPEVVEKTIDTTRVKVNVITPNLEIKTKKDTTRTLKLKQ